MLTAAQRIQDRIEVLASYSENPEFLSRPFCSPNAKLANEEIKSWAANDNIDCHIDNLANIRLRARTHDPSKKTFVVASHLDSVINAGKYDGPLGFLMAYEMLKYSIDQNLELPFNLEAIGFSDEEGVRYQTTYLGSSAVAGLFQKDWLEKKDESGISMRQALQFNDCEPAAIEDCKIERDDWLGYYEVHIEQGPILQNDNTAVGLVKDIYGQARIEFQINGFAGHAGTVPMGMRQDALAGFAEFVTKVETLALEHKNDLVATVGQCGVEPGASNVIPGKILATIDIRSHDELLLDKTTAKLEEVLNEISRKRDLAIVWKEVQRNSPVYCNSQFNVLLEKAIQQHSDKSLALSSGAGHDGVAISKVAPISMLFVRCKDGISHNPQEYCSPEDIEQALKVSISYLENLKKHFT